MCMYLPCAIHRITKGLEFTQSSLSCSVKGAVPRKDMVHVVRPGESRILTCFGVSPTASLYYEVSANMLTPDRIWSLISPGFSARTS